MSPESVSPESGSPALDVEALTGRPSIVAASLLGLAIVVGKRAATIVEVEAYEGADDPASHAYRGQTPRTAVMFGPAGRLYVYRSYGIHWCANIVCGPAGEAGAVLLRGVEPVAGVDQMWADRPKARRLTDLGSGPGKLCAALGIDHSHNGVDVLDPESPVNLVAIPANPAGQPGPDRGIAQHRDVIEVVSGVRIGITKATDRPWRFAIADNPHVSRPRPT